MNSVSPHLAILNSIKEDLSFELLQKHHLFCETGIWLNSTALKLQKKAWTNNSFEQGIFFSVWIEEKEVNNNKFNYNIHALKIGLLEKYSIKAREFASVFRARFAAHSKGWPNLRSDYGPQTLLQGWQSADLTTFRNDVLVLIDRFTSIHGIIDEMLDERRAPNKSE